HTRPIAGGIDTAGFRRKAKPESDAGQERGAPGTQRASDQPPAESPRQRPAEPRHISTRREQTLGGHARVFGVVREHAATEEEVEVIHVREQPPGPTRGQALVWQPHGVADRGADETANDLSLAWHGN